jgi:hypothetical protein
VKAIDVHPFRKPKPMAWPMRAERGKIE